MLENNATQKSCPKLPATSACFGSIRVLSVSFHLLAKLSTGRARTHHPHSSPIQLRPSRITPHKAYFRRLQNSWEQGRAPEIAAQNWVPNVSRNHQTVRRKFSQQCVSWKRWQSRESLLSLEVSYNHPMRMYNC